MARGRNRTSLLSARLIVPSIMIGVPLSYLLRSGTLTIPSHWRKIPHKLPHLVLLWIQRLVTYIAEEFSMTTLLLVWVGLILIIYNLPSSTRPNREERQLQGDLFLLIEQWTVSFVHFVLKSDEIAQLEKEVAEMAEDLQAIGIDPKRRSRRTEACAPETKKSK